MATRLIAVEEGTEALVVQQALAMVRELNRDCKQAADGEVLHLAEQVAVERGRELTRATLEAVLNAQAEEVEKKGRPAGLVPAAGRGDTAAAKRKRWSRRRGR